MKRQVIGDTLIVVVYVDVLVITGSNAAMIEHFIKEMMMMYEMNDLGDLCHFFGN